MSRECVTASRAAASRVSATVEKMPIASVTSAGPAVAAMRNARREITCWTRALDFAFNPAVQDAFWKSEKLVSLATPSLGALVSCGRALQYGELSAQPVDLCFLQRCGGRLGGVGRV